MGSITIDEVITFTLKLSSFIGAVGVITGLISKMVLKHVNGIVQPIHNQLRNVDENLCKNFMARYLKDIEYGNKVDDIETERFWELYDHYTKPVKDGGLGLNSYFHSKVEKLQKEGKL